MYIVYTIKERVLGDRDDRRRSYVCTYAKLQSKVLLGDSVSRLRKETLNPK